MCRLSGLIHTDSIALDKVTFTLFATFKYIGTDWDTDMKKMSDNPVVQRWWEMTDSMQESFIDGAVASKEGPGWWKDLEEVFYTDGEALGL